MEDNRQLLKESSRATFADITKKCCLFAILDSGLLPEYQNLSKINAMCHVVSVILEIAECWILFLGYNIVKAEKHSKMLIIVETATVFAVVLAITNTWICIALIYTPSKKLCLWGVGLSVLAIALFCFIVSFGFFLFQHNYIQLVELVILNSLLCMVQFFPMYVSYRFWDYLTFNHDFEEPNRSTVARSTDVTSKTTMGSALDRL